MNDAEPDLLVGGHLRQFEHGLHDPLNESACFTVGHITAPLHPPGWIVCLLMRTGAVLLSAAAAGNI